MSIEKKQSQQRELIWHDGVVCWLYPDQSHRCLDKADTLLINRAIEAYEAAKESQQPDDCPVNEKDLRRRVMAAIRSYGHSPQDKASLESRADGVMIVLSEYVLPFVRNPKRESVALADIQRVVDSQAEDEGLWFDAQYATEAHLQQNLRGLHAVIEYYTKPPKHNLSKVEEPRNSIGLTKSEENEMRAKMEFARTLIEDGDSK